MLKTILTDPWRLLSLRATSAAIALAQFRGSSATRLILAPVTTTRIERR